MSGVRGKVHAPSAEELAFNSQGRVKDAAVREVCGQWILIRWCRTIRSALMRSGRTVEQSDVVTDDRCLP